MKTTNEPESTNFETVRFEGARSEAISLLSQWARTGIAVSYTASGLRYRGFLRDGSTEAAPAFEFRGPSGIGALMLPSRWTELTFDSHEDWVCLNVKDQSGHECSIGPDQDPYFPIGSVANKREIVRDQLLTWHASRTAVGVSICHPPYDLTFLGAVVDVMNEGCFVENAKRDNLLSLSFEDSICSMGCETIDGVTRLQVQLRHLHTGTTVQISEGLPVRKIRRCSGTRMGAAATRSSIT